MFLMHLCTVGTVVSTVPEILGINIALDQYPESVSSNVLVYTSL